MIRQDWWLRMTLSQVLLLALAAVADKGLPASKSRPNLHLRHRRSKTASYYIGMLVIVDYGLWKRWRNDANSESDAVKNIEFYFTHLIDKINKRYMTLNDSEYQIRVVLQGLEIAKSQTDSGWTETLIVRSSQGTDAVDAESAVDKLAAMVTAQAHRYKQYDHIVGVTKYDLYAEVEGKKHYGKIGSAVLGGICIPERKFSVIEDQRVYASILAMAHEMAHNLNASHDGDNGCAISNENIMTPVVEYSSQDMDTKPFTRFSSCSSQEIGTFIKSLNRQSINCLLDVPEPFSGSAQWSQVLQTLPGQKFDVDTQCTMLVGRQSLYCGTPDDSPVMCQALRCQKGFGCFKYNGYQPFDGTSCGYRKWCIEGACVSDTRAPAVQDSCPVGDYRFTGCKNDLSDFNCYTKETEKYCCKTCSEIRDDSEPGCEYGDKNPKCADLTPANCTIPSNQIICCKRCRAQLCEHIPSNTLCKDHQTSDVRPTSAVTRSYPSKIIILVFIIIFVYR